MKTAFWVASLVIALCVQAMATDITSLRFTAISSASSVTCGVFGMDDKLKIDGYYKTPMQGFAPDPRYSRMLVLGTNGFDDYSTAGHYGRTKLSAVKFTCVVTGTGTPAPVKVILNGIESYFLTTDSDLFIIGR